ncbi:hypothetical protein KEM54_002103, partial [Ascosphaera aggregata]
ATVANRRALNEQGTIYAGREGEGGDGEIGRDKRLQCQKRNSMEWEIALPVCRQGVCCADCKKRAAEQWRFPV